MEKSQDNMCKGKETPNFLLRLGQNLARMGRPVRSPTLPGMKQASFADKQATGPKRTPEFGSIFPSAAATIPQAPAAPLY